MKLHSHSGLLRRRGVCVCVSVGGGRCFREETSECALGMLYVCPRYFIQKPGEI